MTQQPPFALIGRARRRHRGAIHPLNPAHLDFLRRRLRRLIVVQLMCFGFRDVPLRNGLHDHSLRTAERPADHESYRPNGRGDLGRRLAVDGDLAALACVLRFGARPEQARDVEPDVEANRVEVVRRLALPVSSRFPHIFKFKTTIAAR